MRSVHYGVFVNVFLFSACCSRFSNSDEVLLFLLMMEIDGDYSSEHGGRSVVGKFQRKRIRSAESLKLGFRALEDAELMLVASGGKRKSLCVDAWALNRFNDWRSFVGLDCTVSLEDLFESNVSYLVDLLSSFFLQVQRRDGSLYLGESLVGLLRGLGRLIRARLEERSVSSGIAVEEFFIMTDPRFKKAQLSCLTAVQRSVAAGVGRKRKTNECLTPLHVQSILAQSFMQLSTPCGCLMRLAFYVCHNFCVRGYVEMYNLMVSDFEIMYDHMGKFVRFHERSSKNHKVDLLHCQPVTCYFPDVVATFEAYFDHLPKWLAEDGSSCPLFLRGIDGELSNPSVRLA
ncbi:hypothetical protein O6H91_04G128000 [Diphasiastrum complanatum]|uniref:Uncharacterized protein n=1 Tax=Diphasiastrum complanatum TaxID=34168 RepID=A0ACC2E2A1_DIPCM|nr:hypothetical protein O6H91_04G128000 [Diphasiastrum complanatum]